MAGLPLPRIAASAYVHPRACVLGRVVVGPRCSLWPGAVLRGDQNRIRLGRATNVQDNAVIHVSDAHPCMLGSFVSIGHGAVVHGCTIGDRVVVGMHATVLDGAVIESDCLIGAGAVVAGGLHVPRRSLVLGVPGRVVRKLGAAEVRHLTENAQTYLRLMALHRSLERAKRGSRLTQQSLP